MTHPAPAADAAALAGLVRRVDPADAGAQNNLGVVLLARGRREEAAAAFARALALDPQMTLARRNLDAAGGPELRARRAEELRARLRADATDADARRELAQHLAAVGRLDEAKVELERLCAQRPRDPGPRVHRALCAQAAGDLDDAVAWLEDAVALDPRGALPRLHLAEVLYHRGEPNAALTAVDEALALAPDHADGHNLRAFVLGELNRPDDAIAASARARELNPALARADRNLAANGIVAASEGPIASAPTPRSSAAAAPVAEGHLALGAAFRQKGYLDEAIREYRRALARGEEEAFVVRALAEIHLLRGAPSEAAPHWARATAVTPNDAGAWHGRAVAAHLGGVIEEAEMHYRRAAHLAGPAGNAAARARNDLGVLRASHGDLAGAARAFAAAAAADPSLGAAHLNRAAAFFALGQADRALAEYRALLARTPSDPDAWAGVGAVLAAGQRHAEAKAAFARALDADPSRDDVRYELAFVAAALGEHGAALRETERAMAGTSIVVRRGFALAFDFGAGLGADGGAPALASVVQRVESAAVPGFHLADAAVDALLGEIFAAANHADGDVSADGVPYALAEECLAAGLYERAAAETSRALARGADRAQGLRLLADVFARQGYFGEALERYEEARTADPSSLGARRGELRMLRETGRRAAARIAADALAADHPWDAETLALGALVRADDVRADDAHELLARAQAAAERDGTVPDVWKLIADGWHAIGDHASEVDACARALTVAPEAPQLRLQLARALAASGNGARCASELERLIADDASAADARVELSALRARSGDVVGARQLLVDVLAADPLHYDALAALAALLVDEHRHADARVAVERVLRADADHALALAVQGDVLEHEGRTLEAWRRWERAVALEPFGDGAARARRALARANA